MPLPVQTQNRPVRTRKMRSENASKMVPAPVQTSILFKSLQNAKSIQKRSEAMRKCNSAFRPFYAIFSESFFESEKDGESEACYDKPKESEMRKNAALSNAAFWEILVMQ